VPEVFVGTDEAEVVLPMAICEYAFQIDRLSWIQRGPFCDLLFQSTVPAGELKRGSDILSDALKETVPKRQAPRRGEAGPEYE